ncbi:hypothetical protein H5410_041569, partial [Solanum commersonii]
ISTRLEEVDIPQNLDLLNKWTISKVSIKTIYDYGWFDKISNKQLIKTTEQSLALNSSEQTIRLLNKRDIEFYKSQYKFLHIGMVQIAFKPLTLKGLPETFLAALCNARNLKIQHLCLSVESHNISEFCMTHSKNKAFSFNHSRAHVSDSSNRVSSALLIKLFFGLKTTAHQTESERQSQ